MTRKMFFAALLGLALALPATADMFFDDFNAESGGTNYTHFAKWNVSDGSVDVIGVGTAWNWFPANGKYVDMDGSTGNAGKITTKTVFDFEPGTYTLSFDLAGNQRPEYRTSADTVVVQVGLGSVFNQSFSLGAMDPFTHFTRVFTVSTPTSAQLSFEGLGGDNIGMLLDNVQVTPVPGAVLLGLLGLSAAGWKLRRFA